MSLQELSIERLVEMESLVTDPNEEYQFLRVGTDSNVPPRYRAPVSSLCQIGEYSPSKIFLPIFVYEYNCIVAIICHSMSLKKFMSEVPRKHEKRQRTDLIGGKKYDRIVASDNRVSQIFSFTYNPTPKQSKGYLE